jgi:glyoxylase I family protein
LYEVLHHVSLVVTNLEDSKRFYGVILGLEESQERPDFDFPGAWYDIGQTQLHLIVHKDAKVLRHTTLIDTRDGHFAIRVKGDMKPIIERLKRFSVDFVSRPQSITGWHQVFITDPDGNVIEFNARK